MLEAVNLTSGTAMSAVSADHRNVMSRRPAGAVRKRPAPARTGFVHSTDPRTSRATNTSRSEGDPRDRGAPCSRSCRAPAAAHPRGTAEVGAN